MQSQVFHQAADFVAELLLQAELRGRLLSLELSLVVPDLEDGAFAIQKRGGLVPLVEILAEHAQLERLDAVQLAAAVGLCDQGRPVGGGFVGELWGSLPAGVHRSAS